MGLQIAGPARLQKCPKDYQDRIDRVGGKNRYRKSNFILVWGEAWKTRAGGYWEQDGGEAGYRDVYLNDTACWHLMEWHSPEEYGTPESYYIENYDELTGLQICGEYPYRGRYEVLFILRDHTVKGNKLEIEPMPLNAMLIDLMIPLMMAGKHVSYERRAMAIQELREKEEKEQLTLIADARQDAQLAFSGNLFSSRHGRSSELVEKKMAVLQNGMVQAYRQMKQWGKGVSSH